MTKHRKQGAGDQAPGFSVRDLNGRDVTLTDYRGRKLLLVFFRYGACPLCNLRMSFLIKAYLRWQANGLDVVAVFESPAERLLGNRFPSLYFLILIDLCTRPTGSQQRESTQEFSLCENSKELNARH